MFDIFSLDLTGLSNEIFYGIDLGTSYTVVSCIDASHLNQNSKSSLPVTLIQIEQASPLPLDAPENSEMVASILAVDEHKKLFVGNKLHKLKANPEFHKDQNIFYHWKLDLGVSLKPLYPEAVRADLDDAAKIAGKILNYCRINAVGQQTPWNNVIITVPASFQANQRTDVLEAAKYANIETNSQMLIDEPDAAFLGYLNQIGSNEVQNLLSGDTKNILVIDFGGGTCDLSALSCTLTGSHNMKVTNLAISRYNDLGGQDLDMIIAEKYLLDEFLQVYPDSSFTPEELEDFVLPQLAVIGEKLKIDLCRKISATVLEPNQITPEKLKGLSTQLTDQVIEVNDQQYRMASICLGADKLEEVTSAIFRSDEYQFAVVDKVIQSIPGVVDDIFRKANWNKEDLDYVLLVGGSIQNPLFIRKTEELMNPATVIVPQRPDTLVSTGAAIYSFYHYAVNQNIIQPICSDTIGIITVDSDFYPLVESGVQLPFKASIPQFSLQNDYQTLIEIPFCINSRENVVGILRCPLHEIVTQHDKVQIEIGYSIDKVIDATVLVNNKPLGSVTIAKPQEPAALTPGERQLAESARNLEAARAARNRNGERTILRSIIWEFYNVSNYTRAIAAALEFLKKFNNRDASVWNILYCAYDNMGQRKKAEEALNKAIEISPYAAFLLYNKSLLIEKSDGYQGALDFLKQQPDFIQEDESIRYRIAWLESKTGNMLPAKNIADRFDAGKENPTCEFDSWLLNRVLKTAGITRQHTITSTFVDEDEPGVQSLFDTGSLLRTKKND